MNEASNNPVWIDQGKQTEPQLKKESTNPVEIDQGLQTLHQLKDGSTNFDSEDRFPYL